ncbi:MAG TPA: hypothetical protein VF939_20045 [Puia sp.]
MKQIYAFLAGTVLLMSSCSSSRKAAQTPDDVYYSPASNKTAAASGVQDEYYSRPQQGGDYYSTAPNDQYVRLKVQDPARWSYFDDYSSYDSYYSPGISSAYGYGYSAYGYGLGFGFGPSFGLGFGDPYMCWNSYFMWNSWYNPYFYNPYYGGGVLVVGSKYPSTAVYSHLRTFNGNSYSNGLATRTSGSNDRFYRPRTSPTYYSPGTRNGNGNRYTTNSSNNNYYRPANSNSSNNISRPSYSQPSYSQPVRTYSAPSGGGGGGFSRPGRH